MIKKEKNNAAIGSTWKEKYACVQMPPIKKTKHAMLGCRWLKTGNKWEIFIPSSNLKKNIYNIIFFLNNCHLVFL